jgi:aminopeptidase
MIDPDAFAALICDWCLEVEEGQQIKVETSTLAQDAAVALHGAILRRGAWPLLRLAPPLLEADFYRNALDLQLDEVSAVALTEERAVDATVSLRASGNTNALAGIDTALVSRAGRARRRLQEARAGHRWCVSQWPTPAQAQAARMGERDYIDFMERALFLDRPDPTTAWRELSARQASLVARLDLASVVRIESERTDLTLNVAGRTWINSDGRRNMPSGEVFTGPHEDSASGTIFFDVPSTGRGADVAGVEVRFVDGCVVSAHAEQGDEHLQAALALDEGARFLGELGIGTNAGIDRATGSTLLDEKIAGTIHLALGRSYPETGGVNDSALHWDLICDLRKGGKVTVDGETMVADGVLRW